MVHINPALQAAAEERRIMYRLPAEMPEKGISFQGRPERGTGLDDELIEFQGFTLPC